MFGGAGLFFGQLKGFTQQLVGIDGRAFERFGFQFGQLERKRSRASAVTAGCPW